MFFSHLKHHVAFYCALCCTKAKKEWEQFGEFLAREGVHFSPGSSGWQQNCNFVKKIIWKHLMFSLAFIKLGASSYYKCWRRAYYEAHRRGIFLTETPCASSTAVIVSKKRAYVLWWKRGEVYLIHDRLIDKLWSGNSGGRIWGHFPGNETSLAE